MKNKEFCEDDFCVEDIYTTLEDAKEEVWRRWNNEELKKKVLFFLNHDIVEVFNSMPKAVLARHVASPNNEFVEYLNLSREIELEPVCLEYLNDKFRAENEDKYYLGKLIFLQEFNIESCGNRSVEKIIDFDSTEGMCLSGVRTLWGENFVSFHHELLNCFLGDKNCVFFDASDWINRKGKKPVLYYEKFFALFLCFGVLFEDYLENKKEKKFTIEIVLPSFKKIYKQFGLKPLVVRLHDSKNYNSLYARSYCKEVMKHVSEKNKL